MILTSGIKLYHGSYSVVKQPALEKCYPHKDFGQGFYLATSKQQAASFVRSAVAKAVGRGDIPAHSDHGYLSEYTFHARDGVQIFEFTAADIPWLHCVAAHRRTTLPFDWLQTWSNYDILAGSVANDRTNPLLPLILPDCSAK